MISSDSPQFDGKTFHNPSGALPAIHGWPAMLKRCVFGKEQRYPATPPPQQRPDLAAFAAARDGVRAIWISHSTVLVNVEGTLVLTDPVFSQSVSPLPLFGPSRFNPALAVTIDELPDIDVVLLSHDHYDHLDKTSIQALTPKTRRFVAPLGVDGHLLRWGVPQEKITVLDWWETTSVRPDSSPNASSNASSNASPGASAETGLETGADNGTDGGAGLSLVCLPAQHFSGRGLLDRSTTLWSSWAIVGQSHRVFFGGDSGYHAGFAEIGQKHGPFDLTLLECGAYSPHWPDIHMQPEQTAQAHRDLRGKVLLPIHWATFNLSLHGWSEPVQRLLRAAAGLDVATPMQGEVVDVAGVLPQWPWWRGPGQAASDEPLAAERDQVKPADKPAANQPDRQVLEKVGISFGSRG